MSAATSTAPATQDMRRAGAALGALALAAALVVAAAFTQVSSTKSQAAPAAGSAATAHDHGWSTASAVGSRELTVRGSNGGGINYTGIPYPAPGHADLAVPGEFVLGPGNLAPVGIAVALPPDLTPMRGEFRLGPGLAQPSGIAGTMQQSMTQELIVRSSNGGGLNYTGIPYPAPGSALELTIRGSNGGGISYTGIPYPAPASGRAGGANGTRLAQ